MGRSLRSAKAAGASFEQDIADYLADSLTLPIERRHLSGTKDRGDITGLVLDGRRVVVECKNYGGRLEPSTWLKELAVEMENDKAPLGFVAAKRRGTTKPGEQFVLLTLDQFLAFITNR